MSFVPIYLEAQQETSLEVVLEIRQAILMYVFFRCRVARQ